MGQIVFERQAKTNFLVSLIDCQVKLFCTLCFEMDMELIILVLKIIFLKVTSPLNPQPFNNARA